MALNIILSLMELVDILLKDTGQITQKEKRKEKKVCLLNNRKNKHQKHNCAKMKNAYKFHVAPVHIDSLLGVNPFLTLA